MSQVVYRPRDPPSSAYYQCVQDHFEAFEQVYEARFERQYGFFRPYVRSVIYRFLDCGILHNGFARVRSGDCGHEYFLAFSCKRRRFCPSCHQKRGVEFGEWLCEEVLKAVPHRHFVFSIPKILRRYFLYDRTLFSELSRCARETLKEFFQEAVPEQDAVPGAVIAIHSFGIFLGRHPHLHVLCTDGCFYPLTCPRCSGTMKVISVIEDEKIIRKILKPPGLWEIKSRPHQNRPGRKRLPNTVSIIPYPGSLPLMSGFMWTLSVQRPRSSPSLN